MKKIAFVFFVSLFFCSNVFALSDFEQKIENISHEEKLNYTSINNEISVIIKDIESGKVSHKETVPYIKYLSVIGDRALVDKENIEAKLLQANKKLEALGVVDETGKESKTILEQRKVVNEEISGLKGKLAEIELVIAKINEVEVSIINLRNKEFKDTNLDKKEALISPTNLYKSIKLTFLFLYDIAKSPVSWYSSLDKKDISAVNSNVVPALGVFFVSILFVIYLNSFIRRKFGYKEGIENPDFNTRFIAAMALSVAYGLMPLTVLGIFVFWIKSTSILFNSFFGFVLNSFAFCWLFISLSQTIVRVLFAPYNSAWRLIEVSDYKAKRVGKSLLFSVIAVSIVAWFLYVAKQTGYSDLVLSFIGVASVAVKSFSIILVSLAVLSEEGFDLEESNEEEEVSHYTKLSILVSIAILSIFSLSLFGYTNLSEYILDKIMGTSLIILGFYIAYKIVTEIVEYLISMKLWRIKLGLRINAAFLKKVNFFAKTLIIPATIVFSSIVVLWFWGFSIDLMIVNIKRFMSGFYIGGVKISISSIIFAVVVFFITLNLFKWLRNSLTVGVLSKSGIDEGVRNSLASGLSFLGFVVSILFAIAVAGGSLKNLALIAGALSFGIGLGLQNIVSNFVSGIILLFERPIKVGDWVLINGEEGIVKQISIRATRIQKFNKSTVIIPNGSILSTNVTNLTHGSKIGRVSIPVGVAYGSDIPTVKKALIEAAQENIGVMKNPAPFVVFNNLGDFSMDFELRFFVSNILNGSTIRTEVQEAIVNKLAECNIDIPFPRSVVELEKK